MESKTTMDSKRKITTELDAVVSSKKRNTNGVDDSKEESEESEEDSEDYDCIKAHNDKGGKSEDSNTHKVSDEEEFYNFDPSEEDPVETLKIVNRIYIAKRKEPPPANTKGTRARIVELQDQIKHLSKMKEAIMECLEMRVKVIQNKKEKEIGALYDTFSPFLALGPQILSIVLDYLDAEALCQAEAASYTLCQIIDDDFHWARLAATSNLIKLSDVPKKYQTRPPSQSVFRSRCMAGSDILSYAEVANYWAPMRYLGASTLKARQWEVLGENHYDYAQDVQNSRDLIVRCDGCHDFRPNVIQSAMSTILNAIKEVERYFIRLSLCNGGRNCDSGFTIDNHSHRVLWQGFSRWGRGFRVGEVLHFYIGDYERLKDWPELEEYYSWEDSYADDSEIDLNERQCRLRKLVKNLRVTVLLNDTQLLITSGGFYGLDGHYVCLHPRNDGQDRDGGEMHDFQHATSLSQSESLVMPCIDLADRDCVMLVLKSSAPQFIAIAKASDSESSAYESD